MEEDLSNYLKYTASEIKVERVFRDKKINSFESRWLELVAKLMFNFI